MRNRPDLLLAWILELASEIFLQSLVELWHHHHEAAPAMNSSFIFFDNSLLLSSPSQNMNLVSSSLLQGSSWISWTLPEILSLLLLLLSSSSSKHNFLPLLEQCIFFFNSIQKFTIGKLFLICSICLWALQREYIYIYIYFIYSQLLSPMIF